MLAFLLVQTASNSSAAWMNIVGTICEIKENIAIIEIADGVKIKVNKSMLYDVVENTTKSENDKK